MRTRIMNQLQALAMNEGYRWKKKLFREQGRAQLDGHNGCFRADLLLRQNGSGFHGDGERLLQRSQRHHTLILSSSE